MLYPTELHAPTAAATAAGIDRQIEPIQVP